MAVRLAYKAKSAFLDGVCPGYQGQELSGLNADFTFGLP
jgi:hypothetical protein